MQIQRYEDNNEMQYCIEFKDVTEYVCCLSSVSGLLHSVYSEEDYRENISEVSNLGKYIVNDDGTVLITVSSSQFYRLLSLMRLACQACSNFVFMDEETEGVTTELIHLQYDVVQDMLIQFDKFVK